MVKCETCNYGVLDVKNKAPICRKCFNQLVFASNMILEKVDLKEECETDFEADKQQEVQIISVEKSSKNDTVSDY